MLRRRLRTVALPLLATQLATLVVGTSSVLAEDIEPAANQTRLDALQSTLRRAARERCPRGPVRWRVFARFPRPSPRAGALQRALQQAALAGMREGGGVPSESAEATLTLMLDVQEGALRMHLSAERGRPSFWRRWLGLSSRAARPWMGRSRLDPQLRTFIASHPQTTRTTVVARAHRLPDRGYLALLVQRIEGRPTLMLIREADVQALRLEANAQGRLQLRRVAHAPLPPGETPGVRAQRPIATLTSDGDGMLGSWGHRRGPLRLHLTGGVLTVAPAHATCPTLGHALEDACAMPVDGRDYFASALQPRAGHATPGRAPTSFYARSRIEVTRIDGRREWVEVVVSPRGRLVVQSAGDTDRTVGMIGHGAALGVADVDHDGAAELVTSTDAPVGEPDRIVVRRVTPRGGLRTLWTSEELEGSVMVAGAGDLDGDGMDELLAIEEPAAGNPHATLWVVH